MSGTFPRALEVFRFEVAYQLSRVSTRIYFALFVGLAIALTWGFVADARRDGYYFNAPIITMAITVIASMVALLVIAAVAGDAATRDGDTRIDSLLYTTPVGKAAYLGGRFLGALAVTAILLVAIPIGLLLATSLPGVEQQILGPFRAPAYLGAYFFFALPNAFIGTAVLFSLAALTRRAIATYAGGVFLFFAAFVNESVLAERLAPFGLDRVLDPLGYTALITIWRSLNPFQKKTFLPALDGALLTNRLLWVAIAVTVLGLACARFRFAHVAAGGRSRSAALQSDDARTTRWTRVMVPAVRREFGLTTRLRQLVAVTVRSYSELVRGRAWWIVPVVALVFVFTAPELLEVDLGTPGAATAARIAALLGVMETALLITLLIALSAGELVWREREARIHAISDVTPVPAWLSVTGKFLAIALMLATAQLLLLIAGVSVQVIHGYYDFNLRLFATVLFGFQLTGYLLTAALAMAVHSVLNQKYIANAIVVLTFIATDMARELGVRHNLLLYGSTPGWSYSDMGGFGWSIGPWLWFAAFWGGWALLFAVATYLFWIRGEERGARGRIAIARRRLTPLPAAIGATALAIVAGAGGFVFYNTNVLNRYYTDADYEQRRAEYERRYRKFAAVPQPVLKATKLHVDFFPDQGDATIRGSYVLENRTRANIDTIHLATNTEAETKNVTFDRPSRATLIDRTLGHQVYTLSSPIAPGQSAQMVFTVEFAPRGFTNTGRDNSVMRNGSWIEHRGAQINKQRQWLPVIGYESARELNGAVERAHHKLPPRPANRPPDDLAARREERGHEQIRLETVVGTTADQVGVAPGTLRRSWASNGRRYAHYVTDTPISNGYAIYSADYAVHRTTWRDREVEIFHHPTHAGNLDRMVRSVQASLDYHTANFSPYPYRQLRVIEFPTSGGGMGLTAHHTMVKFSEGFALARPGDDPRRIDVPFAVMAHEIGHQWWGHQIVPADVEGAALLSESLAWYSGMLVVEKTLGRDHLMRLLAVMRAEYLGPQETRSVPLLRATDRLDAYRTGPFAMFALREALGEERVNLALRNLISKFPPARPPYPTSLDLYAELRAVAPAHMHYLLKDLFEDITSWDLRAANVDVRPDGNGVYRVDLRLDAQKLKADGAGKESPVPMNDLVEIAVFDATGTALYRRPHRIRSGAQTISMMVKSAKRPARAEIDPDRELLDRAPLDNAVDAGPTD